MIPAPIATLTIRISRATVTGTHTFSRCVRWPRSIASARALNDRSSQERPRMTRMIVVSACGVGSSPAPGAGHPLTYTIAFAASARIAHGMEKDGVASRPAAACKTALTSSINRLVGVGGSGLQPDPVHDFDQ